MDALLVGAVGAMAFLSPERETYRRWAKIIAVVAGATAIVLLAIYGPRPERQFPIYTFGLSAIDLAMGAIVYLAATAKSASVLSARGLRFLGTYAYGLYVFHVVIRAVVMQFLPRPELVFGTQLPWQLMITAICMTLSLAIAITSYRFFEQPILSLKRYFRL